MAHQVSGLRSLAPRPRPRTMEPTGSPEVDQLRERVLDLEARLRALTVSRRVLITLLISSDRRRKLEVTRLKLEVEKLRGRNRRFRKALTLRRVALHRLRNRLDGLCGWTDDDAAVPEVGSGSIPSGATRD